MKLPVVLLPEAQAEFYEAFDWYEQRRAGLGVQFVDRVQEVFDRVSAAPHLYEQVFRDVRRAVIRGFPYLILYRVADQQVVVLAVFHGKRDPAVWKSRA
jgi:plasmid stabilization system protein ParE